MIDGGGGSDGALPIGTIGRKIGAAP